MDPQKAYRLEPAADPEYTLVYVEDRLVARVPTHPLVFPAPTPVRGEMAALRREVTDLGNTITHESRIPRLVDWLNRQRWVHRYAETRTATVLAWPVEAWRRLWRRIA